MQRILIVGQSGSGKSTLSCMLSSGLGLPWHNGDQILRHPDASLRNEQDFRQQLDLTSAKPSWIMDGNIIARDPKTIARADTLIWLDYDTPLTAFRFASRSLARLCDGETLIGAPRKPHESFTNIAKDIYWGTTAFIRRQSELKALYAPIFENSAAHDHLQKIRLHSPTETSRFLKDMGIASTPTRAQKRDARKIIPSATR